MKSIVKRFYQFFIIISICFFIWLFASWINVFMNNNPFAKEHHYAKWNAFGILLEIAGVEES